MQKGAGSYAGKRNRRMINWISIYPIAEEGLDSAAEGLILVPRYFTDNFDEVVGNLFAQERGSNPKGCN